MAEAAVESPQPTLRTASLVAGLAYPMLWNVGAPPAALIALKGSAVGLLALIAARQARSTDGWLLAAIMAFGALGDVLLEIWFEAGVAAFAAGHVIAIALYRRNRRTETTPSQKAVAALLPLFGLTMPFLLLGGHPQVIGLAAYSLLLTLMAAAAWLSRFPRRQTGLGAVLFVISDTLIAARMGPLAGVELVSYAIWLLYFFGQVLIFVGVNGTLREKAILKNNIIPAKAGTQ
jgi:uncharacterized membrane protein YhhN